MTCVLGMIVRREREIRNFVKTPFTELSVILRKMTHFWTYLRQNGKP